MSENIPHSPQPEMITGVPSQEELVSQEGFVDDQTVVRLEAPSPGEQQVGRPEFTLGNTRYELQGFARGSSILVFDTTRIDDGRQRPLYVYTSKSAGTDRVSQGMEPREPDAKGRLRTRWLKGSDDASQDSQYTIDTQLHPAFENEIEQLRERSSKLEISRDLPIKVYTEEGAEQLMREFAESVSTFPLGSAELSHYLHQFKAGDLSRAKIAKLTGHDPEQQPEAAENSLMRGVAAINHELRSNNVLPDFTAGNNGAYAYQHPILGNVQVETFIKERPDGIRLEWRMAHDEEGRAWVEHLRFADAEVSDYGTDKQLVYSGMLTTKPLDYSEQVDGLPLKMRPPAKRGYADVSSFVGTFAPVADYLAARAQQQ